MLQKCLIQCEMAKKSAVLLVPPPFLTIFNSKLVYTQKILTLTSGRCLTLLDLARACTPLDNFNIYLAIF